MNRNNLLKTKENKIKLLNFIEKQIFPIGTQLNLFDIPWDTMEFLKIWDNKLEEVEEYIKINPELGIIQVLVDIDIIPDYQGNWHYITNNEIISKWEKLM